MSYQPIPYRNGDSFAEYMMRELLSISRSMQDQVPFITLQTLNVSPTKPQTGMTVLVDGTNWNPGSGAGVYTYYGSAWHKLG